MFQLGLRTLAIAKRQLKQEEYKVFDDKLHVAKTALDNRESRVSYLYIMDEALQRHCQRFFTNGGKYLIFVYCPCYVKVICC